MASTKNVLKVQLFVAIERGDTQEVREILQRYPEFVNLKSANHWTPILFATRYGYLDIVRLLCENGANLDMRNPLNVASYSNFGNYDVVKYLLSRGVSANSQSLMASVVQLSIQLKYREAREVISLLLLNGAVYEHYYEYIDKETKQQVRKIVRYNDPHHRVPDRSILSFLDQTQRDNHQQQVQQDFSEAQKREHIQEINAAKISGLLKTYLESPFGVDLEDEDFGQILKYM